ncbi:hypothetical protein DFR44_10957 [Hydromonas duriensis]|uniref:Uncharacterized protein n=1 Tax=Hydromonas duriensis TaxID=1527608 RepID=A0A4R6Y830_9BURK|nr:hypothetical protein DFR44_10957 [Hydromonas duriensis]
MSLNSNGVVKKENDVSVLGVMITKKAQVESAKSILFLISVRHQLVVI